MIREAQKPTETQRALSTVLLCVSVAALCLCGCESVQRKFTRKSKRAEPPPSPIINFQDYTRAMTPLDRYRKHYLMFDYWNDELIESLQSPPLNPKRFKRASTEALGELHMMQGLVSDDLAGRMAPLIHERSTIDRQLQAGGIADIQAGMLSRTLEAQTRHVHREFFWRDVQDQLKQPSMSLPQDESATP